MKNKIYLKWSKSVNNNVYNFGDDLGPYLVGKLSGYEIKNVHFAFSRFQSIKNYLKGIIKGKYGIKYGINFIQSFFLNEYLITVGSILQWYSSSRSIVWGSGIISANDKLKPAKKYYAVRGKYTLNKIEKFKLGYPVVLGDPALLLPLIYKPKGNKKYLLGIIPHYIHYDIIIKKQLPKNVLVIKLNAPNIEEIINDINSCEYTISSSLHGLIVSHTYNIKSLWYIINSIPLAGDNIKFLDYFSSVKIPEYMPFNLNLNNDFEINSIISNIENNNSINFPNTDLKIIYKDLIKSAPFRILPQYCEF